MLFSESMVIWRLTGSAPGHAMSAPGYTWVLPVSHFYVACSRMASGGALAVKSQTKPILSSESIHTDKYDCVAKHTETCLSYQAAISFSFIMPATLRVLGTDLVSKQSCAKSKFLIWGVDKPKLSETSAKHQATKASGFRE